jgi:hypothetical protein
LEERALADSDDSDRFVTSGYGDAITSFVDQTRALAKWQHRAQQAEAALARVYILCDAGIDVESADRVRAAMKGKP